MALTYEQIQARLEAIENDLGRRQHDYEQAAEQKHRLAREFELRHARAFMAASGDTATERKVQALIAVAAAEDGIYQRNLEAEAAYEGAKAAIRTLETRATVGMSLLKAHTREAPQTGPQPHWSDRSAA